MASSKTPFNDYNVRWQIGEQVVTDTTTNQRYKTDDLLEVDYPLPARIGAGGFTSVKLDSGLSLHHSIFRFTALAKDNPVSAIVEMDLKEPCLLVHSVLTGALTRRDEIKNDQQHIEPGTTMLQWVSKTHSTLKFAPLPTVEVLYVHASQSSLQLLLGQDLTTHLRDCVLSSDKLHSLPTAITAPLRFCFDDRLKGSRHKLHAQNKTLEFLENLIRYFDDLGTYHSDDQPVTAQVIMQYLKQRTGQLPSAGRLATLFGVSVETMNEMFVNEFGMSVAAFMKEQRMAQAHEWLSTTTSPVAEIAAKLGYKQVSNFSAAFKAFYGYSPRVLRRSALSDEP
jgi:AraC-like DNA-binding protein